MRYVSRKSMLTIALASSTKTEILKGNKLLFLTSLGLVSGYTIEEPADDATLQKKAAHVFFSSVVDMTSKQYVQILEEDEICTVPGDGSILLQDVEVSDITRNNIINLPYLILFFDQIIGVTLAASEAQRDQ